MKFTKIILATATVALLSACAQNPNLPPGQMGPQQTNDTVGGALLGGLTGALVGCRHGGIVGCLGGVAVGATAGGVIGNNVGAAQDERAAQPQQVVVLPPPQPQVVYVAPIGQPLVFSPAIIVLREGFEGGVLFREYEREVVIGGRVERVYGVAHRQLDGGWKTVREERRPHH